MKIPIFVSSPTALSDNQKASYEIVLKHLNDLQLEARRLGDSDYPNDYPLREVAVIASHCSGGIILGFEQFRATKGIIKPGTNKEEKIDKNNQISFPTPWNHLESGILFGLKLPLLIFRESQISGGVFDEGVTDVFVHKMPFIEQNDEEQIGLNQVFLKWHAKVSEHYYKF